MPALTERRRSEDDVVRRARGFSARMKFTLSYAAAVMVAGLLLLAAVWFFVLRYLGPVTFQTFNFIPYRTSDPFHGFGIPALILMIAMLLVGLFGGWFLAGRMLGPLDRIAEATRAAASGSLAHRIRLPGRRDEFRELADAFDAMLEQLEAQVAAQGRFAANASHELRTPLAVTRTLLEVARTGDRGDDDLVERLHAVNERAIDLTEALLLLSRADGRSFVREPVDLSLLAEQAAETLLPLAERRGVRAEVVGELTPVVGSHVLLQQLCTNLLHNGIVHNLSEGGAVWITCSEGTGTVAIAVENTGPLVPEALVDTLAEPFQRGAARVRNDHAGVGLGLAIVKSIVEAHDGKLDLAPRREGGLRVTVELPVQPVR